jgi:hypothetical protein
VKPIASATPAEPAVVVAPRLRVQTTAAMTSATAAVRLTR